MTLIAAASAAFSAANDVCGLMSGRARQACAATEGDEAAFECPDCGSIAASGLLPCRCGREPRLAALPRVVAGKFIVERRLGVGGMGLVYLASDTTLERKVALKTLPGLTPEAVRRLRDEARAMAALNHDALATLYGIEFWRGAPILVVEYFPNGTLADRLARGPLPAAETIALGLRLSGALVYMHARGILHRDLKPSNIGFDTPATARLLDFGLAISRAATSGAALAGTRAYLPPEADRGAPPSTAFDLWALSVIMLEAVCGPHAFAAINRRPIAWRRFGWSPALDAFFQRALALSPNVRFQTAADFEAALEDVAQAGEASAPRARVVSSR